jgi:hypothetical protein
MTDALDRALEENARACKAATEAAHEEYLNAKADLVVMRIAAPAKFAEAKLEVLRVLREVYLQGRDDALR